MRGCHPVIKLLDPFPCEPIRRLYPSAWCLQSSKQPPTVGLILRHTSESLAGRLSFWTMTFDELRAIRHTIRTARASSWLLDEIWTESAKPFISCPAFVISHRRCYGSFGVGFHHCVTIYLHKPRRGSKSLSRMRHRRIKLILSNTNSFLSLQINQAPLAIQLGNSERTALDQFIYLSIEKLILMSPANQTGLV